MEFVNGFIWALNSGTFGAMTAVFFILLLFSAVLAWIILKVLDRIEADKGGRG